MLLSSYLGDWTHEEVEKMRRVIWCMLCLNLTGCLVPVLWANPPTQVSALSGVAWNPETGRTQPSYDVRAAVHPLALSEAMFERPFDMSLGYSWSGYGRLTQGYHGAFVALDWLHIPFNDNPRDRLYLRGMGHLLLDQERMGWRTGMQLGWQRVRFAHKAPISGNARTIAGYGVAHGEGGFGVCLEVSRGSMHQRSFWSVSAGILYRLPAFAGVWLGVPRR